MAITFELFTCDDERYLVDVGYMYIPSVDSESIEDELLDWRDDNRDELLTLINDANAEEIEVYEYTSRVRDEILQIVSELRVTMRDREYDDLCYNLEEPAATYIKIVIDE